MLKKLSLLPNKPGVYRFLNEQQKIIYVGKAKDLKKRVSHYFQKNITHRKTLALMQNAVDFEITVTENENQALLLESNLIKQHRPKYNVLLRDDKSYPYLFLSEHDFPRIDSHRGPKKEKGRYFGPYPNAGSVRENKALIQKLFKLRQCSDSFFSHRSRPCLQYEINRCTAPCVKRVSREDYQAQVQDAVYFLQGKNREIIHSIEKKMEDASHHLEYERAAQYRDLLIRLRKLQSQQFITGENRNCDIFGVAENRGEMAIAVLSVRHGQLLGHKTFFLQLPFETTIDEALSHFIPQYYFNPIREAEKIDRIILSHALADRQWIQNALQEILHSTVQLSDRKTEAFREWISIALSNAIEELNRHQTEKNNIVVKLKSLQKALALSKLPEKIECFDISHTQGEATKASCVVWGVDGPIKKSYRQFDIENITPGDDYAAMKQVLSRRYKNHALPDILIVDGGKGQLTMAANVLADLHLSKTVLLGVAKGVTRKAGVEKLWVWGVDHEIALPVDDPARHLIQFIRDEAHRFAITAHRRKRDKNRFQSVLDTIVGVGKKRKNDLLTYFGGLSELKKASIEEIVKVRGVSHALAKQIYNGLHNGS